MMALAVVAGMAIALVRHRTPAGRPAGERVAGSAETAAARLEKVESFVAERNRREPKSEAAFRAAGWTMVSVEPPDPRLTELDPTLIAAGRESDLRMQLASAAPAPRHARRIAQIALQAKDPVTRESAVDALGRIRTAEARAELIDLLTSGKLAPDDLGRRQIAALIHPDDLDDETAAKMAGLLDSERVTAVEKQQIAFTLALTGLRDGMTLEDRVLATMSPEARALLARMTDLGKQSFIARGDGPDHSPDHQN
jgi:hypothetical protein